MNTEGGLSVASCKADPKPFFHAASTEHSKNFGCSAEASLILWHNFLLLMPVTPASSLCRFPLPYKEEEIV